MTNSIENQIAQANAAFAPVAVAAPVVEVVAPTVETAAAPVEPAVPLTRAQQLQKVIDGETAKIEAATKRRDLAATQLANIDKIESIKPGSLVTIRLGRAETLRDVAGAVAGIKVEANGDKKFKVLVGQGYEAEVETVGEGQIVSVNS